VRIVLAGLVSLCAGPAAAQGRGQVDSIVVQRFVATRPNHIPLTKRRVLSDRSPELSSTLQTLGGFGFDSLELSSADVPSLCRVRSADSTGMWVTVFTASSSRRVIIPDQCDAQTPDDAARVEALRAFAWETLRKRR
jgi:hypothetical protein